MSEQRMIKLADWADKRFSIKLTNTCLANYGRLGFIQPPPEKIAGKWMIERTAIYIGRGNTIQPVINDDDDETLKEILNHVTTATKK
jgi:hypothetical protein